MMTMMTLYATALFLGGSLLMASAFLGGHDVGHGVHLAADHDHAPDGPGTWLPFLSFRFWTFGVAFFGLTGVIFDGVGLAGEGATLAVAIGLGLACGLAGALILRALARRQPSSLPTEIGCIGEQAEVLLDIGPGLPGRVRVSVKGSLVDLPAETEAQVVIARGSRVLVLDVTDGRARVGPAS